MDFTDRTNRIFHVLGCSNAEIARISKIDPSLVSRFRTGSRKPRATSTQFKQLCKGIISYAQEYSLMDELIPGCFLSNKEDPEDELISYLVKKAERSNLYTRPSHTTYNMFSEKLNVLMNRLDITNIRLARALNIDTSLVSRYRKGLRTPPKNSTLMANLCGYLYKAAKMNGSEHVLLELPGISKTEISDDEILELLICWLSDEGELNRTGDIDRFLEKLDSINILNTPAVSSIDILADTPDDLLNEYTGADGLRKAVIRFLRTVLTSDKKNTLKLYSNKKLDWLSSDQEFLQRWAAFMYAILRSKNQIQIIHHIERNLNEMLVGIDNWLPLYMSGLVEGYFCKTESDTKFSHTLFIASGTAGIYGSFVSGTEETGIYQYADTPDRVHYYEKQFDALLAISQPLVQVFKKDKKNDFLFCKEEMSKPEGNTKRLLHGPSIATMPIALLEGMLKRVEMDQKDIDSILFIHENCVRNFERDLMSGHVTEHIAFPDDPENAKLNLYDTFSEKAIYYTSEEYSEHIKAIIALLDNSNYDIVPLPESPFDNIQINTKENAGAIVQKTDIPFTVLRFTHPAMCNALGSYIHNIGHRNRVVVSNRKELIEYLEQFCY